MVEYSEIRQFIGKTPKEINVFGGDEEILFEFTDGTKYKMHHDQDCCESVTIEDLDGDLQDLIGLPLTTAEQASKDGDESKYGGSSTWSFYRLGNEKVMIVIRWYGSSNGYYSESVDITEL